MHQALPAVSPLGSRRLSISSSDGGSSPLQSTQNKTLTGNSASMSHHGRRGSHSALPPPFQYRRPQSTGSLQASTSSSSSIAPHSSSSPSAPAASGSSMQHENESYQILHQQQQQHLIRLQQQQQQQQIQEQQQQGQLRLHQPVNQHVQYPGQSANAAHFLPPSYVPAPPHGHNAPNYPPPPATAGHTSSATSQCQVQQVHPTSTQPQNQYPSISHAQQQLQHEMGGRSIGGVPTIKSAPLLRSHSHSLSHSHIQQYARDHPGPYTFHSYRSHGHHHHNNHHHPPPFSPPPPSAAQLSAATGVAVDEGKNGRVANGQPRLSPVHTPDHAKQSSQHQQQQRQQLDSSNGEDNGASDEGEPCESNSEIKWMPEEDNLLREAVVKFSGKAWKRIAEYCFPDGSRDKDQCLQRWRMISKPRSVKGPWTPEEDRQLRSLVNELGAEKWVLIASRLGSRTGKQCRERWHNHLDPTIDKSPFTPMEDELIFKLFDQLGSKWAEMSKLMPGRPDNAIKNYFNTSMQRKRRRLSLQDPSELQLKFTDHSRGGMPAVTSPLGSPTAITSPSIARSSRFDPYERRHSMPSLELPPKQAQPPVPTHTGNLLPHMQQQHQQHQQQDNGAPKTPDAKISLRLASGMSRSVSLGSSDRPGAAPNRGMIGHEARPSMPNMSVYHGTPNQSRNPHHPHSTNAANPHHPSSSMAISSGYYGPQSPQTTYYNIHGSVPNSHYGEPYHHHHQQQHQHPGHHHPPQQQHTMPLHAHQSPSHPPHSQPRTHVPRQESLNGQSRYPYGHHQHEHHRSLDLDALSQLAELATRDMSDKPGSGRGSPNTVVVQSKEEMDDELRHDGDQSDVDQPSHPPQPLKREDPSPDAERAVLQLKIGYGTQATNGYPLTRRMSMLGHVAEATEEEEEDDKAPMYKRRSWSEDRSREAPVSTSAATATGTMMMDGRGGHESFKLPPLPFTVGSHSQEYGQRYGPYRSKRSSPKVGSPTSEPNSDQEQGEDMAIDNDHHSQHQQHELGKHGRPQFSPPQQRPGDGYLSMRRGSVRELMAINHLCLSSDEVDRE